MNSGEFEWESLINTDVPAEYSLKAALFTTYDRAENRLLAEHILPLLLRLNREPDGEGLERQYFLLELDNRLKQLHDKIVVVSSMLREEPALTDHRENGAYSWIWRSIRHLSVGGNQKAVQHAKLWILHWSSSSYEAPEYIEILVSSANLTSAAFKGQIQAAWRACIKLHPQTSQARLNRWGILPRFLHEMAISTREEQRFNSFIDLLSRAECPAGATFIASVPGTHSREHLRRFPWGAAGLHKIAPSGRGTVSISIYSPFVGSWIIKDITKWCLSAEGSPKRLKLVWIDKDHPWARDKWVLPLSSLKSLTKAGSKLLHLRYDSNNEDDAGQLHCEHRSADARWSHAKIYELSRGNSRCLIVTSANFSTSAWGKEDSEGRLAIENFELGVCLEQNNWNLFDELDEFEDASNIAAVSKLPSRGLALIQWAEAVWDGKSIKVECRCQANFKIKGYLDLGGKNKSIQRWKIIAGGLYRAVIKYGDVKHPPLSVYLSCEQESVNTPIFDSRPFSKDRFDIAPPECDVNDVQIMRDELLFEQYGGRIAAEDDQPSGSILPDSAVSDPVDAVTAEIDGVSSELVDVKTSDSYSVPAFELARDRLRIVDNWSSRLKSTAKNKANDFERQMLYRDGEQLLAAFKRQARRDKMHGKEKAIGAELSAQEMKFHLKYFPES